MTVQSDDRRLTVECVHTGCFQVWADIASPQQVFDALLPLLPPPVPTTREVAVAAANARTLGGGWAAVGDLARRWDEGGQP